MELIDDTFLREVGLFSMPDEQREQFLQFVEEELEVRIGEKISDGVAPEKLKEFELAESNEVALAWLAENKPNFKEIIDETILELKTEIVKNRDKILG